MEKSAKQEGMYTGTITIRFGEDGDGGGNGKVEPFQILMHKRRDRCIHPNKEECTQVMPHEVIMDSGQIGGKCWMVGMHKQDQAQKGDVFTVQLLVDNDGKMD